MTDLLTFMGPAVAACIVLVGLHAYLGIHVLERGVIFVDLGLAQIAALGTMVGVLFGLDAHGLGVKLVGLAFTFLGAAVFAATRTRNTQIPQEAIIGIVYAVASAGTILVGEELPHGAEEAKSLLIGHILWVTWPEIGVTALLYLCVGLFHYFFRRQFLTISRQGWRAAQRAGIPVRLWDFLFYVSFGFVVTSSVAIAGVLLVFIFLIVPAVAGALFARGLRARLAIGYLVGVAVSIAGCAVSFYGDLPTGATVVVCFGIAIALLALVRQVFGVTARA